MIKVFWFSLLLGAPLFAQDPLYYTTERARIDAYIFRTYTDPRRMVWLLADSAMDTAWKSPHQWDRSPESYGYRVASGWGRRIVRNTAQLGFESALKEDSRYRPSASPRFTRRFLFAVRQSVVAYKPDGSLTPAYGRMAAGVVGAAASSTWHPQSVNASALLSGVAFGALDRAGNNLLTEFTPDLQAFGRRQWNRFRSIK